MSQGYHSQGQRPRPSHGLHVRRLKLRSGEEAMSELIIYNRESVAGILGRAQNMLTLEALALRELRAFARDAEIPRPISIEADRSGSYFRYIIPDGLADHLKRQSSKIELRINEVCQRCKRADLPVITLNQLTLPEASEEEERWATRPGLEAVKKPAARIAYPDEQEEPEQAQEMPATEAAQAVLTGWPRFLEVTKEISTIYFVTNLIGLSVTGLLFRPQDSQAIFLISGIGLLATFLTMAFFMGQQTAQRAVAYGFIAYVAESIFATALMLSQGAYSYIVSAVVAAVLSVIVVLWKS